MLVNRSIDGGFGCSIGLDNDFNGQKIGSILSFQDIILRPHTFWGEKWCLILQPFDMRMGAGTFHPATTLRALGPEPWNAAFVQPCRRPTDGRYGENPNRLQHYYQYQVILKPSPEKIQDWYLDSLLAIGIDPSNHDIRFVEDDWESPTLGAWDKAGKSGVMEWRSPNLPIFNKWEASIASQCQANSHMVWNDWRCIYKALIMSLT